MQYVKKWPTSVPMQSRGVVDTISSIVTKFSYTESILAGFRNSKFKEGYFTSGINLNSSFAPKASAILLRKDKLGVLEPFSSLAMEGCRVPTISASWACVKPLNMRSRVTWQPCSNSNAHEYIQKPTDIGILLRNHWNDTLDLSPEENRFVINKWLYCKKAGLPNHRYESVAKLSIMVSNCRQKDIKWSKTPSKREESSLIFCKSSNCSGVINISLLN